MKRIPLAAVIMIACLTPGWTGPKGTAPRSGASKYPVHTERAGAVSVGVRLLTRAEVSNTFVSNLNECCVVVELAVFPEKGKSFPVSLNDVSIRIAGTETTAKAASATVVSATLQKTARQERDITISPVSSIGYESGSVYDPASGTQRNGRGVYTSAGVGIGIGQRGDQPGASDKDRSVMETELTEKGLPEGTVTGPVAGYVYFQLSPKGKNTKYQLQYTVNGEPVNLVLQ